MQELIFGRIISTSADHITCYFVLDDNYSVCAEIPFANSLLKDSTVGKEVEWDGEFLRNLPNESDDELDILLKKAIELGPI